MLDQTSRTAVTGAISRPPGQLLAPGTVGTGAPHADFLDVGERMVVATIVGCFAPVVLDAFSIGSIVDRGAVIGHIGDTEVTSPFSGLVGGHLAVAGERVRYGQPLLWLRAPT